MDQALANRACLKAINRILAENPTQEASYYMGALTAKMLDIAGRLPTEPELREACQCSSIKEILDICKRPSTSQPET